MTYPNRYRTAITELTESVALEIRKLPSEALSSLFIEAIEIGVEQAGRHRHVAADAEVFEVATNFVRLTALRAALEAEALVKVVQEGKWHSLGSFDMAFHAEMLEKAKAVSISILGSIDEPDDLRHSLSEIVYRARRFLIERKETGPEREANRELCMAFDELLLA